MFEFKVDKDSGKISLHHVGEEPVGDGMGKHQKQEQSLIGKRMMLDAEFYQELEESKDEVGQGVS